MFFLAAMIMASDWKYVAPATGAAMEHPPLRALEMAPLKPEGVTEAATYRGVRRSYTQLRYGSPSSVRVTMVLDERGGGEADLYVDRDRDRRIDEQDRLPGAGPLWRFKLDALEMEGDAARVHKREVVVRRGKQRGRLSAATVGYLEGTVELEGRTVACRRTDEDASGRFGDVADRFYLDLDRNGVFEPISEQFAVTPIWTRSGKRYAVHSDAWKGPLAFEAILGEGTLTIAAPRPKDGGRVTSLRAGLAGRDGTPAALSETEKLAVPPGDYRMDTLNLAMAEKAAESAWQFTFSHVGGKPHVWRTLHRDETMAIDPVGELSFSAAAREAEKGFKGGDEIGVDLRLFTGDGLLINEALRTGGGTYPSQPMAKVTLETTDGRLLSEAHSGFA